jgi:hypothetical protein
LATSSNSPIATFKKIVETIRDVFTGKEQRSVDTATLKSYVNALPMAIVSKDGESAPGEAIGTQFRADVEDLAKAHAIEVLGADDAGQLIESLRTLTDNERPPAATGAPSWQETLRITRLLRRCARGEVTSGAPSSSSRRSIREWTSHCCCGQRENPLEGGQRFVGPFLRSWFQSLAPRKTETRPSGTASRSKGSALAGSTP